MALSLLVLEFQSTLDPWMEVLRARFGAVPDWVRTEVESLTDEERLRALLRAAATAESLAAVFGRS